MSLEDEIRKERYEIIGKAIVLMNRWERIWWAITGHSRYMKRAYWEKAQ